MERDKTVSRLFLPIAKNKKKTLSSRPQAKKDQAYRSLILPLALVLGLAAVTAFMAFPMPSPSGELLMPGDISGRDIKARRDLMVLDKEATAKKREEKRRQAPKIFDLDDQAATAAKDLVHQLFERGRAILNAPALAVPLYDSLESSEEPSQTQLADLGKRINAAFNLSLDDPTFTALVQLRFVDQIEKTILNLVTDLLEKGVIADKSALDDQTKSGRVVRHLYSRQDEAVQNTVVFPTIDETRWMIEERAAHLVDEYDQVQVVAMITVARALLRPNLVFNAKATEERQAADAAEIAPVFFQVKRGEMIVREGERVDEIARLKLEEQARQVDLNWWPKAGGLFVLLLVFLGLITLVSFQVQGDLGPRNRDQSFLAALFLLDLLLAVAAFHVGGAVSHGPSGAGKSVLLYLVPIAGGSMLATIFLGPVVGFLFSVIGPILATFIFDGNFNLFLYHFLGSIIGVAGMIKVRERSQIITTGLKVGGANLLLVLAFSMAGQTFWSVNTGFELIAGLIGGLLAGVMTTGLVPLFEMLFRYTTDVKLLELANLDKPVLRELMVQAPGTYHHSVIVAAMVEAAAEAIGANSLLAKVSAYYHDLGKMKKPLYFVENQLTCENKHEKLAPSLSSLILISHVKDGVDLARRHKLSPLLIDIIQQHHGTSLISYFYQKAKNQRTEDQPDIDIEAYRYPGPKPQTREAGLIMLADAVEAASRTVGEPNPARVQGMVQKIINNIFSDGQLDECELTLKDLHSIARSFNKILTGIFHRRISYPEPASKDRTAHGHPAKQPTKDSPGQDRPDKGPRKEDLKRLGMS